MKAKRSGFAPLSAFHTHSTSPDASNSYYYLLVVDVVILLLLLLLLLASCIVALESAACRT